MGASLRQRRRVRDDGLRVVNRFQRGRSGSDGTRRRSPGQIRASSRGNTKGASVIRIHWAQGDRRRLSVSGVKSQTITLGLHSRLGGLSLVGGSGISGVAVECADIRRNTGGEGGALGQY